MHNWLSHICHLNIGTQLATLGVIGLVLGLVGPDSVYSDLVR